MKRIKLAPTPPLETRRPRPWWRKVLCKLFHRQDHVCFDDLWWKSDGIELPGNLVWVCNRCTRAWHTPNPQVFQSELNPGPMIWGEYAAKVFTKREKELKEIENAKSEYRRKLRASKSVSDPTGSDRPDPGGEHTGECGAATDGECPPSI